MQALIYGVCRKNGTLFKYTTAYIDRLIIATKTAKCRQLG